jgi:hypothetical protein
VIQVDSISTVAIAGVEATADASSEVVMSGVSLVNGLIRLDSLRMILAASSDGATTTSQPPIVELAGLTVGGAVVPIPAVSAPAPGMPGPLDAVLGLANQLLAGAGVKISGPVVTSNDANKADPGLHGYGLRVEALQEVPVLGPTTAEVFLGLAAVSVAGIGGPGVADDDELGPAGGFDPGAEVPLAFLSPDAGSFKLTDLGDGVLGLEPVVKVNGPAPSSGFLASKPEVYTALVGLFGLWQVLGMSVLAVIARHRHGLVSRGA